VLLVCSCLGVGAFKRCNMRRAGQVINSQLCDCTSMLPACIHMPAHPQACIQVVAAAAPPPPLAPLPLSRPLNLWRHRW
jgi:hypothetical protein